MVACRQASPSKKTSCCHRLNLQRLGVSSKQHISQNWFICKFPVTATNCYKDTALSVRCSLVYVIRIGQLRCLKRIYFPTVQLRVRIDCEAIPEAGVRGGASEMPKAPEEPEAAAASGMAVVTVASGKPQAEGARGFGVASIGNGGLPQAQGVLNQIALKYLGSVDPSTPEEFNGFLHYMEKVRKVLIVDVQPGSLIITVECNSLEILEGLWDDYCTGHLNEMAQKYLVTDCILKEFGLKGLKLTTTILEDEYRVSRDYFLQSLGEDVILCPKN